MKHMSMDRSLAGMYKYLLQASQQKNVPIFMYLRMHADRNFLTRIFLAFCAKKCHLNAQKLNRSESLKQILFSVVLLRA